MISDTSRYASTGTTTAVVDGQVLTCLHRRLLPQPSTLVLRTTYVVTPDDDRSDRVAYALLGDPLQYWQLLDANGAMSDDDLLRPGARIRVTWPASVGSTNGS